MIFHACLLCATVQLAATDHLLILNSAADPFVPFATQQLTTGTITLAEDNIATLGALSQTAAKSPLHVAFHDYILHHPADTIDVAIMNLLYQPANAWMNYGLQVALYALRPGGRLYVLGAKDRGILSMGKRVQEQFGNLETLIISKGQRVLCSYKRTQTVHEPGRELSLSVFASNKLDEGTQLLLAALQVHTTDRALDIGSGAGFIGLHLARLANKGYVTMVDSSLAAVATTRQEIVSSGLTNVQVLPSNGAQAVLDQRFDLVVTNPPFHQGGLQTTEIAQRFIREAAQILLPKGRFYLVANRFLKYEPTLKVHFGNVEEIAGTSRFKVLLANSPLIIGDQQIIQL